MKHIIKLWPLLAALVLLVGVAGCGTNIPLATTADIPAVCNGVSCKAIIQEGDTFKVDGVKMFVLGPLYDKTLDRLYIFAEPGYQISGMLHDGNLDEFHLVRREQLITVFYVKFDKDSGMYTLIMDHPFVIKRRIGR